MSRRWASVTGALTTTARLDDPAESFAILRAWSDVDPGSFPDRLDTQEPIRERIYADRIEESGARRFGGAWYATRGNPRVLAILQRGVRDHGTVGIYSYDPDASGMSIRVGRVIDAWSEILPTDFGMVHSFTEAERLEATSPWRSDVTGSETGAEVGWGFTVQLHAGLPTLYWRTLLGRPYIELFGLERLLTVPAFSIDAKPWGLVIQLTAEPPSDDSYASFGEIRERAIDHLGRDAFIPGLGARAALIPSFSFDGSAHARPPGATES